MVTQKPQIDPRVRDKLDELGADAIRAKLVWIINVRTLAQQNDPEPLGGDLSASPKQMQEWLAVWYGCRPWLTKPHLKRNHVASKARPVNLSAAPEPTSNG